MKIVMDDAGAANVAPQEVEHIRLQGPDRNAQQELWDKLAAKTEPAEAPITKADTEEGAPEPEEKPLPDRALVDPGLRDFLVNQRTPEPNPVVEQASRIEEALHQLAQPAPEQLPVEQILLQKLNSVEQRLAQREAEDTQRRAKEDYDRSMNDFKAKFTSSIEKEKENYPGIVALGRSDVVFSDLVAAMNNGQDISAEKVLSKHEEALRADYERLRAVYGESKASNPSNPDPKQTKQQPTPSRVNEVQLTDFTNKKEAQEALWEKIQGRAG